MVDQSSGQAHPRCNWSTLAVNASFPHWHFCTLEPGHERKHRCMSCKVDF